MNVMNPRRFILILTLLLVPVFAVPSWVEAEEINVADHGIVPGKDVTLEVVRLIESVRDKADITLVFPQGTYEFFPDNAFETYRTVANHDNGLKRIAFPLFGCRNITIDGGGSLFRFHGHMIPVTADRVDSTTLKNFSIDWIRSFHAELKVVEQNTEEGSATYEIDSKAYPHEIKNGEILFQRYLQLSPIGSNIVFDPKTRAPIFGTDGYKLNGKKTTATKPAKNLVKLTGGYKDSPPPLGSVLIVYGVHPTSRLAPAIHITNSKGIHIQNVTVHDAGGMALIVERTENVSLDQMVVTSNDERLVCTRADATHFIGCKGTIKLENCLFEHMLDDGVNVHGAYVKVAKYLGKKQFLCEISHFQQWGLTFAEPGDRIALLSRTTILPFAESTITAVEPLNEKRFILTIADEPETMPEGPLSIENLTWNPDLIMRKNTIRENRARSVLVTTKGKVLIEDNTFSSQMHGILIEGDNNKWYESGAVGDVTIRNNVFENIGFARNQRYPLLASPLLRSEQRMGEGHFHRNINFTGNTIKTFNGLVAKAVSVQGLNITDNKIELSTDYPVTDEGPAIVLEYCDDVSIANNSATGFDRSLTITASADVTNVESKDNKGFERR